MFRNFVEIKLKKMKYLLTIPENKKTEAKAMLNYLSVSDVFEITEIEDDKEDIILAKLMELDKNKETVTEKEIFESLAI